MVMMNICTKYSTIVQIGCWGNCVVYKLCCMFDGIVISCFGMNWSANWCLVAVVACVISVGIYNSRPDEPGSPRRD